MASTSGKRKRLESSFSSNIFINPLQNDQGSPIGLNLTLSASDINQLESQLPQNTQQMPMININGQQQQQLMIQPLPHHKLKVSSIPAVYLEIGNWKWKSTLHDGDLVAKFYYGMKKLVWEFIDGHLKKKIEIRWSQISAINSSYVDQNKTTRLQIQLKEHPKLCEEVNFNSKMHTQWAIANDDFTKGQARICLHHTLVFRERVLDGPFMKLLHCDNRLFGLSQQPFPYPYPTGFRTPQILDFSCNKIIHGSSSSIVQNSHHLGTSRRNVPDLAQPIPSLVGHSCSNIPPPPVFKSKNFLDQNAKVDQVEEQSRNISEISKVMLTSTGDTDNDNLDLDDEELVALLEDTIPELINYQAYL